MRRISRVIWISATALFLGTTAVASAACLPPLVAEAIQKKQTRASVIDVYLDGSQSMSGYAAAATASESPLGDLLNILARHAEERRAQISYSAFGTRIVRLKDSSVADSYATTVPYNCHGAKCDNQESRIDTVLSAIEASGRSRLSVVVTDLWLDNKSFYGTANVALGGPLKALIRRGAAIGVVGIRAPFSGRVYDIPGSPPYSGASQRPLYALLIGPADDVSDVVAELSRSGSRSFDASHLKFSLFAKGATVLIGPAPQLAGGGVTQGRPTRLPALAGLPLFSLDRGLAASQHGALVGHYDASAGVPPGAVWSGAMQASSHVWRLSPGEAVRCATAWSEISPLLGAWRAEKAGYGKASFMLTPATAPGLLPGETYLVYATLGAKQLASPNPATGWMRDWSVGPADAATFASSKPKIFKTLNLGSLAQQMEQGIAEIEPEGRNTVGTIFAVQIKN